MLTPRGFPRAPDLQFPPGARWTPLSCPSSAPIVPLLHFLLAGFASMVRACVRSQPLGVFCPFRDACPTQNSFDSWLPSLPRWRPWRMWSRMVSSLSWNRPQGSSRRLSRRARHTFSALAARSRSRSPLPKASPQPLPRLHPAQPARPHWPGSQELSSCSARALWLFQSLLRVSSICYWPWRVSAARAHTLSTPRATAADPYASAARVARRSSSGAADTQACETVHVARD